MIHYHGTPMTPAADMVKAFSGRHAMVSFANPEQLDVAAEICQSVVLDNGAFSAWKAKSAYDFDGYREWCVQWRQHPAVEWCIIPDIIDGDEKENDQLIKGWPLKAEFSVPVWHMHESMTRLRWLVGSFPRIAIGSSGDFAKIGTTAWWHRIEAAMEIICTGDGKPRVKLHGLRMLDPGIFSKLPLASADSCNVARNVGLDSRWGGPYAPASRAMRALILMDRIERHASASTWDAMVVAHYQNFQLFG